MSQQSNAVAGPSQEHSDTSSLHYHRCWWSWCRRSCYTRRELADHISVEHVQTAQPERLQDILGRKKAEDGYWDSLNFSSLPLLPFNSHPRTEASIQQETQHERKSLDYIPSSLPSPPASTPHDAPSTPLQDLADLPMNTATLLGPYQTLKPPEPLNGLFTPPSKRDSSDARASTPTFVSLRSQPNSPSVCDYNIPDSPSFNSLVDEAIKNSKSSRSEVHYDEDLFPRSEESSQASVLDQLTQEISDEENYVMQDENPKNAHESMVVDTPLTIQPIVDHRPNSPPNEAETVAQGHQKYPFQSPSNSVPRVPPSPPSRLHSPTSSICIGTPVPRQSWYQAPRRWSSQKTSASELGQAQPLVKIEPAVTSPASPGSHSGIVHSSPTVAFVVSPESQAISQTNQSQCWTQTESQLLASYPPLLTQAPYESQSMSQD